MFRAPGLGMARGVDVFGLLASLIKDLTFSGAVFTNPRVLIKTSGFWLRVRGSSSSVFMGTSSCSCDSWGMLG